MDEIIEKAYERCKNYESEEFPLSYRNFLVDKYITEEIFITECLYKIYHSGELWGTRLLDFGSGPSVHKIASATLQFTDVILAEWSEVNRKEVEKWLRGEKDAFDWRESFERCARVEGYRDLEVGAGEIERRIRKAVKKIVPCDALAKNILPDMIGEFDVISLSRCFECCCLNLTMYKEALKKLTNYLKKGGAMVITSILESKTYHIHKTLPALYLTEDMIKEALTEAGLEIKHWFSWRNWGVNELAKNKGIAVHYSVKC